MARKTNLVQQFIIVVKPTPGQAMLVLLLAAVLLVYGYNVQIMAALGISSAAIDSLMGATKVVLRPILNSSATENAALIGFWSSVGLIAYLVSWGFYTAGVAARNEVTIATRYTNQGHGKGPWATLVLKAVCALALLLTLVALAPGINIWLEVCLPVFNGFTLGGVVGAIIGVIGLALQLYLVFAAIQLTFLPWYRSEAFTNELG